MDSARVWEMSRLTGTGRPNPSRETKFLGANVDRDFFFFPVQLTTSRFGNLTRLIHTLLNSIICDDHTHEVDLYILLYCTTCSNGRPGVSVDKLETF